VNGFVGLVRRINLRHMLERKLRTSLTVLGVAAGVTLVTSIVMINATLLSSARTTARDLGGAAEIEVAGSDRTGLPEDVVGRVQSVSGVKEAVPVLRTSSTLGGDRGSDRTLVLGVTPAFASLFPQGLGEMGTIELEGGFGLDGRGIVLSTTVADDLGLDPGDDVTAETPGGDVQIPVTGTISGTPLAQVGGGIGVMLLPAAQETFHRDGIVDSIYVITDPDVSVDAVESNIKDELNDVGAVVGPPADRVAGFDEALTSIAAVTSMAGTVALFVAAFVVFNTMAMSIAERRREVAMAFAFGATRRQVFGAFLGEAATLGFVASVIGIGAGMLLARAMVEPALEGTRVFAISAGGALVVEPFHIVLGFIGGLVVSVAGAFIPARRVLAVAPVESLRPRGAYEPAEKPRSRLRTWLIPVAGVVIAFTGTVAGIAATRSNLDSSAWLTNGGLVLMLGGATLLLPSVVTLGVKLVRPGLIRALGATGRLASDALLRNPGRTTMTVGALVFTLGIVVAVGSALDSFEAQWDRLASQWYGAPLTVQAKSYVGLGADQPLPAEVGDVIEGVDGVDKVYANRYRVINIDGRQTTIYAVSYVEQIRDDANLVEEGEMYRAGIAEELAQDHIVISRFMARHNDLEVGDVVMVPTPSGEHSFVVGGIRYDLNPLDSFYMGAETFLRYWRDTSVDRFEVTVEDGIDPASVVPDLERAVRDESIPGEVLTRDEFIGDVFKAIEANFSVARGVQLAALIVAALAIANTMFIAILERRWEHGLQRAVGMDRRRLTRTLLTEAGIIGLVGGTGAAILGLAMGFVMVKDMEFTFAFAIPFEPSWNLVALALVMGTIIAGLAGSYPSREAARVPIIEALRYE
jgi:putative ABC transport system permease protein